MAEPARLRLVDDTTGEVKGDHCSGCLDRENELAKMADKLEAVMHSWAAAKGENKKLERQLSEAMAVETEASQIQDVLIFWRNTCMPRAKIAVGGKRWVAVRQALRKKDAETRERLYTPLHLKAAVVGAMLSDFHRKGRYLDAELLFRDESKIDAHIQRAVNFKRIEGTSALGLVEELGQESLAWLARRCECGHLYIEHVKDGPAPGGDQPCSVFECMCAHFGESLDAQIERWKAARESPSIHEMADLVAVLEVDREARGAA